MTANRMVDAYSPTSLLEARVLAKLGDVLVGTDGPDIVTAGHIYDVVATGGVVRVLIDPAKVAADDADLLAEAVLPIVRRVEGVERAVVKPRPAPMETARPMPGIRHVIAIHSGKGGVGKSTIAANLAAAIAGNTADGDRPRRIGLLDADIYGPSAPQLMGFRLRAAQSADAAAIEPATAHGVRVMSLGFLMPQGKALAWRGGLVDEGLPQLLTDVAWGDLDLLLIDMPPGTSDVHLAVAGHVALSGMLCVTAPGQTSVQDVRRGMEMFADIAVPCLGLVENMAGVVCGNCRHRENLFGLGGGEDLAAETGVSLLAQLPFLADLERSAADGIPVVHSAPDSRGAALFRGLADEIWTRLPHIATEEPPC